MSEPADTAAPAEQAETDQTPTCKYPGCTSSPEPKAPGVTGPAPKYCERLDHTALTAYRAKHRKKPGEATGKTADEEPATNVVTGAAADAINVREDVVRKMAELRADLDRYTTLLQTITDPEAAEAQITAIESEAQTRIVTAEQRANAERSKRLNAEQRAQTAEDDAKLAEDATAQAVTELDDATEQFERETERIRTETATEIEAVKTETARQIKQAAEDAETARQTLVEETSREVADIREEAARKVAEAQTAAGRRELEAETKVKEMEVVVENERKAAADVKTAAAKDIEEAQAQVTAAEEAARIAKARAEQAARDAETRVAAEKERRTEQEEAHAAELGRAIQRQGELTSQVDTLHTTMNETKDQMREVQTQLTLAQAEVARLTAVTGGK